MLACILTDRGFGFRDDGWGKRAQGAFKKGDTHDAH